MADLTWMMAPSVATQMFRALSRSPDRNAFHAEGQAVTYAQTLDLIARLQSVVAPYGLATGTRVALLSGNRAEIWCCAIACQALGLAITWLHTMASLNDQLAQIADAGAEVLFVDAEDFLERGGELSGSIVTTFTLGRAAYGVDVLALAAEAGAASPISLALPTDLSNLHYTGGTTGRSKGVFRYNASMARAIHSSLADYELPGTPRFLISAPISHVAGSMIPLALLRGGSVYMTKGFDPGQAMDLITRHALNATIMVPTMIYALLDALAATGSKITSLESLMYAGAAISPGRLAEGLERLGPVFSQSYGQTECHPVTVLPRSDHDLSRPGLLSSCGFPVAGADVRLVDEEDDPVPPGEPGEICVRAVNVMDGYWNQPDLTAETLRGGWLHTGDVARSDEAGRLFIVDRRKDMIVTGGFNVYPREVEDALGSHPAVGLSAVVGIPDEKWGEAVMALVICRPGHRMVAEEVIAHIKMLKGSVQAPKVVEFVDSLPLTGLGKIDKRAIREKHWANHSRRVGGL